MERYGLSIAFLAICVSYLHSVKGFTFIVAPRTMRLQSSPTAVLGGRPTQRLVNTKHFQKGDPFRESTGIRPSLHPTTINAIADALRSRARQVEGMVFRATGTVQPIDVALTASQIASSAILKRQETSNEDGMKLTLQEEQTIAGRVLGVIMRLDDLEAKLHQQVARAKWVAKYNEWDSFGVLPVEEEAGGGDDGGQDKNDNNIQERIKTDPLFAMNRAECILAIFLATVEVPQLRAIGESVPDGSKIDFLDSDRSEVVLQDLL